MEVSAATNRQAVLSIPRLGYSHTENVTGAGTIAAYVEFENLQVHDIAVAGAPAWRLDWTAIKFYVQGSVVASWGSGTTQQDVTELYFTPSSLLLFGGGPTIESFCGYSTSGPPLTPPYDASATVEAQATGGYWWEEVAGEGLQESPVVLQTAVVPDQGGYPASFNPAGIVSGNKSGSITCRSRVYYRNIVIPTTSISDVGSTTIWDESYTSSARIHGDIVHEFRRLNPELYGQIIARFGFPETKATATSSRATVTVTGGVIDDPVIVETDTAEAVLTQSYSDMLRIVSGSTDAPLEGPLSDTCYSPVIIGARLYYVKYFDNVVVSPFPPFYAATPGDGTGYEVRYDLGSACETAAANPSMLYQHVNGYVRWWDNLGNKLFASFYPWRPPNNGSGSSMWRPVEGINVYTFDDAGASPPEIGYWDPVYQAWLSHSAIASDLRRKTRPSLRTQGLSDQPFASIWPYAQPIKPLGVCRFAVQDWPNELSKTMTSASDPLWTGTDCTLTHGANIVATPSANPFKVTLDVGDWLEELYQYPHLARDVNIKVTGATTWSLYAIGVDNSETLIASTNGVHRIIPGPATKYAGSWAIDRSAGTAVSDTGADATVDGVSAATLASPERHLAFQLLPGRQPKQLEFRITQDELKDVEIDYPEFIVGDLVHLVPLDHQQTAAIYAQGPGVIIGQHEWFDFTASPPVELTTPNIAPWDRTRQTVFSWLKTRNTVFLGRDSTTDVDTDLTALYTPIEGQTRLGAAIDTLAVPVMTSVGPKVILHNEWQIGPMGLLPHRRRDSKDLSLESPASWVCEVWDQAVEPKFTVSPGRLDIKESGGAVITSVDSSLSIPGWVVTKHLLAFDNDEANDYEGVVGGTKKADLSPWWSYFAIVAGTGSQISQDVSGSLRHVIAIIEGGTIRLAFHGNQSGETITFSDTAINASRVCVRWLRKQGALTLGIWFVDAGSVKYCETSNEGSSFTVPVTIGSGTDVGAYVAGQGFIWVFRVDGAAIKMRMYNANGSAVSAAPFNADITVVASGADATGIAASATTIGATFTLFLSYYASGILTRISSTDSGQTWS